jgi:hypothetical protein
MVSFLAGADRTPLPADFKSGGILQTGCHSTGLQGWSPRGIEFL